MQIKKTENEEMNSERRVDQDEVEKGYLLITFLTLTEYERDKEDRYIHLCSYSDAFIDGMQNFL